MNPHMKFVDGGRRFVCVLCSAVTEGSKHRISRKDSSVFSGLSLYEVLSYFAVPPEYFQHLDHTGSRVDRYERPELTLGAYEFTVTKEYCKVRFVHHLPKKETSGVGQIPGNRSFNTFAATAFFACGS